MTKDNLIGFKNNIWFDDWIWNSSYVVSKILVFIWEFSTYTDFYSFIKCHFILSQPFSIHLLAFIVFLLNLFFTFLYHLFIWSIVVISFHCFLHFQESFFKLLPTKSRYPNFSLIEVVFLALWKCDFLTNSDSFR